MQKVTLPEGKWIDVYANSGIPVGTRLKIQNVGRGYEVKLVESVAKPTDASPHWSLPPAIKEESEAAPVGMWAKSLSGDGELTVVAVVAVGSGSGSDKSTDLVKLVGDKNTESILLKDFQSTNGWEKSHAGVLSTLVVNASGNLVLGNIQSSYHLNGWRHRSAKFKNGIWRVKVKSHIGRVQLNVITPNGGKSMGVYTYNGEVKLYVYHPDSANPWADLIRFDGVETPMDTAPTLDLDRGGELIFARYGDFLYAALCNESGRIMYSGAITNSDAVKFDSDPDGTGVGISSLGGDVEVEEFAFTPIHKKSLHNIIAIGDSQTFGYRASSEKTNEDLGTGWASYLHRKLRGLPATMNVRAFPGAACSDISNLISGSDVNHGRVIGLSKIVHKDAVNSVFFYAGVNDYNKGATTQDGINKLEECIDKILAEKLVDELVVFTIPPSDHTWAPSSSIVNPKLMAMNNWIRTNADSKGFKVFDLYQLVVDPMDDATCKVGIIDPLPDGLHLTKLGQQTLADKLLPLATKDASVVASVNKR